MLCEREAWFQEIIEDSPVSLWVEDWSGVKGILDNLASQGVEDLRGYFRAHPDRLREAYDASEIINISRETLRVYRAATKDELYAIAGSDRADPDELAGFGEQLARFHEGAGSYEYEAHESACDGSLIFTHIRAVIPPAYRNSWSRVLVSIADISERKAGEADLRKRDEQLRDLQRQLEHVSRLSAMGQLTSTLAHKLSQPLTAIMNYGNTARRIVKMGGGLDSNRIIEMLDKALGQATQASAVIHHLREFYERVDTRTTSQDANRIVDDALAVALIDPAQAGIECHMNLCEGLPHVYANKVQIQQVAFNLIANALEAMAQAEKRELTIETSLNDSGAVEVAISDTGPGIPPEIEERLFEPFVTAKRDGVGLGLSISSKIIEAHGGRLWAKPNPGGGTQFHFTLPASDNAE